MIENRGVFEQRNILFQSQYIKKQKADGKKKL
jgi:hypothetical protein